MKHPKRWAIWALAAFFYFYEYFIRVAPSVMVPDLMSAFSVNATAVGALSAFYFYIYAPMQLPVGVMTDRFGARRLLAFAAFIAGLGGVLFAFAPNYWFAASGRFLMGIGSAFGFVGMVYVCSHWFEEKKRGLLIGLGSSIGTLGAVFGEGPLRAAMNHFGWRTTSLQLAILGMLLGIVIFLVVRNDPPEMAKHDEKTKKEPEHILKNLATVCKNRHSWLIAFVSLFSYATTPGFAALWGIPFIHTTYDISIEFAGYAVSMIFIGWAVGGPIIGRYSDKIRQKKTPILVNSLLGAVLMAIAVYFTNLPLFVLFFLFFLIGFVSGVQLLTYGYAIDINPEEVKGTATAFTNLLVVGGGAVIQPFIGSVLDYYWTGQMTDGIRIYPISAYKIAMSFFPLAFLVAFVLGLFLKKVEPKKNLWEKLLAQ